MSWIRSAALSPGHSELLADFIERADLAVVEAEAQSYDVLLALERCPRASRTAASKQRARRRVVGDHRSPVLDQVGQVEVVLVADGLLE